MKTINEIKEKLNMKLTGFTTSTNEFTYENGTWVRPDISYSIYYTKDKEEHYISETVIPEKMIRVKGISAFAQYSESKNGNMESTKFVNSYMPKVKKPDIKRGYMIRYFVQPKNQPHVDLTEINKSGFNGDLTYYKKRKINWKIVGAKNTVIGENKRALKYLNKQYPDTFISMGPLEF